MSVSRMNLSRILYGLPSQQSARLTLRALVVQNVLLQEHCTCDTSSDWDCHRAVKCPLKKPNKDGAALELRAARSKPGVREVVLRERYEVWLLVTTLSPLLQPHSGPHFPCKSQSV